MWVKFFAVFGVFRVGLWLEMIVISPCGGYNPPPTTPWSFKHCWCIEIIIFLPTYFLSYYVHNIYKSMWVKFFTDLEVFRVGLWLEMIVISSCGGYESPQSQIICAYDLRKYVNIILHNIEYLPATMLSSTQLTAVQLSCHACLQWVIQCHAGIGQPRTSALMANLMGQASPYWNTVTTSVVFRLVLLSASISDHLACALV